MTEQISVANVMWGGLLAAVETFIGRWRPNDLRGELQFRNDLFERLKSAVPSNAVVQKEYRHLGTTIDLWIQWKGFIFDTEFGLELKVNLTKKTDFDRLIGQIESMDPSITKIIVVLIGRTDDSHIMKLRHRYSKHIYTGPGVEQTMAIVHVPVEA